MTPLLRARRALAAGAAVLSLAACDDPAELAQEVVAARGECDQDSLKASSEACVQMFERYATIATEAIHTYIGGMKAMDQALDRMPPADFDTTGLGHAITLPLDGSGPETLSAGTPSPTNAYDAARLRRPAMGDYGRPAAEEYDFAGDDAGWSEPRPRASPIAPQRGVLRPPAERLGRPWLQRGDPAEEDEDPLDEPAYREPAYGPPPFEDRYVDEPPYEERRARRSPRKQ